MSASDRAFESAPYGEEDAVDIWRFVVSGWWARWFLAAGALIGLVGALTLVAMRPDVYRSQVTFAMARQAGAGQFSSVSYLRPVAKSDQVRSAVGEAASQAGVPGKLVGLGVAQVVTEDKAGVGFEMLVLNADATDAGSAQGYAKVFANVMEGQARAIDALVKRRQQQVVSIYPEVAGKLADVQRRRLELVARQAADLNALTARVSIESKQAELAGFIKYVVDLDGRIRDGHQDVRSEQSAVMTLEKEIAGQKSLLTVTKGLSPDAMWLAVLAPAAGRGIVPDDARLSDQIENPVYTKLAADLADHRTKAMSIQARLVESEKQEASLVADIQRLQREIADGKTAVSSLQQRQAAEISVLDGALDAARAPNLSLLAVLGEAVTSTLADSPGPSVGPASLPLEPLPRPFAMAGAMGILAGLLVGGLVAWVKSHIDQSAAGPLVS